MTISQTEYDCPAHRERDAQERVRIWLIQGVLVCTLVLLVAFTWVMIT